MPLRQTLSIVCFTVLIAESSQLFGQDASPVTNNSATAREKSTSVNAIAKPVTDNKSIATSSGTEFEPTHASELSTQVNPRLTEDQVDACLFVLEWQLSLTRPEDVVFLAIGRSKIGWIDPSDAVIKRLSESGWKLLPASKARLPKRGEMENDQRYRGVEVPATGKRSSIYYATVTKWIDENTAEVSYGRIGGPLDGGGGTIVVSRKDGKWSIKKIRDRWVF